MEVNVSYDVVEKHYPEALIEFERQLAKSRSKEKGKDRTHMRFTFSWGQKIQAYTFAEVFEIASGTKQKAERFVDLNQDPTPVNVRKFIEPSLVGVCLIAKIGHWQGNYQLTEVPYQVIDHYCKLYRDEIEEKKRWDNLSAEEQEQEQQDALNQLRGTPGFMEFRF